MDRKQISPMRKEEEDEACSFAINIATLSVAPMVLKAVIELDVLEIIKKAGPGVYMSPAEIATQLPVSNPGAAATSLDRMLCLLASYSILTCSVRMDSDGGMERLYGLGPVCEYLTKNEDGASLAPFFVMLEDKTFQESWYCLKDAILESPKIAFEKAHGVSFFEYCAIDSRFNDILHKGLSDYSIVLMRKILETYSGFEGLSSIVDVGGGIGACLNMIISKYPSISGINFDLPHVIKDAPSYSGVEHIGGDMFISVPKGNAIFLKRVCHNWTDAECLKLLKNCHAALPDEGKVIVCEQIPPIEPHPSNSAKSAFNLDALMLALTPGKERTLKEYEALANQAGFQGFKVAATVFGATLMEFLKK
ncbi:Caffeic acid 3-O-methyltransferase [Ancistrocladus abbreviatus]